MKKRLLSILLMCCMVLTLLPTTAFATGGADEPPVCTCETACTAESMNAGCAVCGAAGASVESCAKYAAPVNGQDNKPYSTQSFLAENLVDPMIWIHLSPDGGGYYAIENGKNCTRTAADFFQPGKAPKGAKIAAVTPPTSPSIQVSVNVDSDGTLSCTKTETTTEIAFKSEIYTVTITSDDYAPITALLTVRQYLNAGFQGPVRFGYYLYGDTYTYKCWVNNPGENGVWSALIRNPEIFEIYQETTDTTSELGKSIYTVQIRAIKAGRTCIDFLYLSDTRLASSKDSDWDITGGTVSTRPLTVTAGSATITEGDTLPTDLVTCTGILDSEGRKDDRDTVLDNALSYKLFDASNTEIAADTARHTPGTYTVVPAAALKSGWDERYSLNKANGTLTVEKRVDEQFTLTPGGRYYFDLSAMDIPGTANSNLPDSTLHYVPFTYVGTVNAYSLKNEADNDTTSYEHSLFIANYNVTHTVSWNDLNTAGLLFGKDYAGGGVNYTLRAPSAGFHYSYDQNVGGTPRNNEWDVILDKAKQGNNDNTNGYVKNWQDIYSWGQDKSSASSPSGRSLRGYRFSRHWYTESATRADATFGFRPVLELPTDLAADSLKVVEVRLGGTKIPGETGNWINIIVKKGESFTAPSADGLPRPNDVSPDTPMWWTDGNGNYYKPGSTVPADVSMIYPLWGGFGLLLDRGDGAVEVTPDNYTDIFGDGSASFVLPKGETFDDLINYYQLNEAARHKIYSTGKYGENIFPNLKLKNAELTSVTLNRRYIEQVSPFFITLDGKNTIGSLSGVRGRSMTLSILGGGTLALNSISDFGIYAQNDVSVTIADALNVGRLYMFSGSLTVTDDTQAVTLGDTFDGYYPLNVRVFAGNSAQDAVEVTGWQLSLEMLALYQRFYAGETLTNDENSALKKAIKDQWDVIRTKLSGKPYARFTQAWDVTYQPGTNGKGDGVTDVKFYGDALTLRDKLFTRSGYTQTGWATTDGGEKIYAFGGGYDKNQALTLYPVWTRNSSGGGLSSYPITIPDKTENGSVTVSPKNASKGSTVTITVKPDIGYVLETITATDKNGNDLKLTNKGNGKYIFTMPGSKVEVKVTFMEDNSVLNFFYDVPNDAYYYEAVKWAVENGITGGVGNSLFAPNQSCTRAQIVTFLWRVAGSPVVNYLMPFTDVDEGAYYAEAVRWAASTGIVTGLTETTFGTDSVCTRAQAAAMIYRCAQAQGKGFTGAWMFHLPFTDVPEWAYESVAWCYMNGVTTGVSETSFAPGNDCTRAQIVTFLWRCKK